MRSLFCKLALALLLTACQPEKDIHRPRVVSLEHFLSQEQIFPSKVHLRGYLLEEQTQDGPVLFLVIDEKYKKLPSGSLNSLWIRIWHNPKKIDRACMNNYVEVRGIADMRFQIIGINYIGHMRSLVGNQKTCIAKLGEDYFLEKPAGYKLD